MTDSDNNQAHSIWREILNSIIESQKDALRIARAGAIIGALLGLGAGIYWFGLFSWIGIGVGLIAGTIIGGVGLWLMYQIA